VAPGSAYEVSTLYLDRKNLMQELAVPRTGMFNKVRYSAYDILKINFDLFSKSANYRALGKIMRSAKINLDELENGPNSLRQGMVYFYMYGIFLYV
jgi:hypothetical protein